MVHDQMGWQFLPQQKKASNMVCKCPDQKSDSTVVSCLLSGVLNLIFFWGGPLICTDFHYTRSQKPQCRVLFSLQLKGGNKKIQLSLFL